ncbi:hypothetical protein HMPREF9016_01881 [Neisseria sp. oral taxon 014 str. F0314]|nr:hypothetical protein HMPREF9016_01881 [Neisseria sp. oral taxon 014 str. F0314]
MFSITRLTVKGAKTYERDFFQTASSPKPKKRLCHVRSAAVFSRLSVGNPSSPAGIWAFRPHCWAWRKRRRNAYRYGFPPTQKRCAKRRGGRLKIRRGRRLFFV